jgi:hypothetical protein
MQPTQDSKVYRARNLRDGVVLRLPEGVKPGTMFVVTVNPTTGVVTGTPCVIVPKQPEEVIQV